MAITGTISNQVGFPISPIPGDRQNEEITEFIFPSCYGGASISFDVQFSYEESGSSYPVTNIFPPDNIAQYNIEISSLSTDTVRISGSIANLFNGETWDFLMRDNTVQQLSPVNTQDWVTIVKWKSPTTVYQDLNYNFGFEYEITPGNTASTTASIVQAVFWSYNNSLNLFQNLLSQGEV